MIRSGERVKDTTTTTGTVDIALSGTAPTGYVSFNSVFGNGSGVDVPRFYYCCQTSTGSEWEVGIGYLSGATTLVRETVIKSSNSDALVNFSSGTKDVFETQPGYEDERHASRGVALMLAAGNFLP